MIHLYRVRLARTASLEKVSYTVSRLPIKLMIPAVSPKVLSSLKSTAVLHQAMADEAQHRSSAGGFLLWLPLVKQVASDHVGV